jgi:hypothetical protein
MDTLSCQTFRAHHAQLQLFALAYTLGRFLRRRALPKSMRQSSLTVLKENLDMINAKIIRPDQCTTLPLAEVVVHHHFSL